MFGPFYDGVLIGSVIGVALLFGVLAGLRIWIEHEGRRE